MGFWGSLGENLGRGISWVGQGLNMIGLKKGGRVKKAVKRGPVGLKAKKKKKY